MSTRSADTFIFIGPSISFGEVPDVSAFNILPPVERGDLYRLLKKKPKAIGIIDGYFGGRPAVSHKEILECLYNGVAVYGASSIGALRAAEMESFGMHGVGQIFEMYKNNVLQGDDEVALTHLSAEHGYRSTSFPLVELRQTLKKLDALQLISHQEGATILQCAQQRCFTDRHLKLIIDSVSENSTRATELLHIIKNNWVYQKKQDALTLLREMTKNETPGEIVSKPRQYTTWELHHKMQYEDNYIDGIPDAFVFNLLHRLCKDFSDYQCRILTCLKVVQSYEYELDEEYDHQNNVFKILQDFDAIREKNKSYPLEVSNAGQLLSVSGTTPDHLTLQLLQSEGVIKKFSKEIRSIYAGVERHCNEHGIDLSLLDANTVIINKSYEKR